MTRLGSVLATVAIANSVTAPGRGIGLARRQLNQPMAAVAATRIVATSQRVARPAAGFVVVCVIGDSVLEETAGMRTAQSAGSRVGAAGRQANGKAGRFP